MARKRSIKPEFFSDVDLAGVCIEARFLFAGMWPWMDRQGVIEADPRVHRVNVFPHDEKVTANKVQSWLGELIQAGFVLKFSWLGKDLLFCPTFTAHQKLFPDERSRFNVSDELLAGLSNDAPVPASIYLTSDEKTIGSVSEPVRVRVEVKVRSTKKEETGHFDFESLYKSWPRKRGKDAGMNRLRSRITSPDLYDQFAKAVKHFVLESQELKTEKGFIPYWSSFVGTDQQEPWRDYIDWTSSIASEETKEERIARMTREREGVAS